MRLIFGIFCFLLLASSSGFAQSESKLKDANTAYKEGRYADAILLYEQIINEDKKSSDEAYYNLGNAYFKLTDYPNAILNYERALRFAPSDEDILFNLELANEKIEDKIEAIPQLFYKRWFLSIRNQSGQDFWAILFLIFLSFSVLFLGGFFLSNKTGIKKTGFYGSILSLIIAFVFLAFAFSMHRWQNKAKEAIVFAGSVSVKSSPVESGTGLFVIHAGTKVQITDELGEWKRVKLADGNEGWMLGSDIEEI